MCPIVSGVVRKLPQLPHIAESEAPKIAGGVRGAPVSIRRCNLCDATFFAYRCRFWWKSSAFHFLSRLRSWNSPTSNLIITRAVSPEFLLPSYYDRAKIESYNLLRRAECSGPVDNPLAYSFPPLYTSGCLYWPYIHAR